MITYIYDRCRCCGDVVPVYEDYDPELGIACSETCFITLNVLTYLSDWVELEEVEDEE